MNEIQSLGMQINFNSLIYYFKSNTSSPVNVIGFKGPLDFCWNILGSNTKPEKAEGNKKQYKSHLNEISIKSENQLNTIKKYLKSLQLARELPNYLMIILKLHLRLNMNQFLE